MNKEDILKALKELHKSKKRNFNQTIDFIINLKDFDVRINSINLPLALPHPLKKCKIFAFLERKSTAFDHVITKAEIDKLDDKGIKKMIWGYDFCVASAKLMPEIARKFGRILGPLGKMPDPKAGCVIMSEDETQMDKLAVQLRKMVKIKTKENSIKIAAGKEEMKDEEITENCMMIYNSVFAALPQKGENVKNIMIKLTMSKPIKILK